MNRRPLVICLLIALVAPFAIAGPAVAGSPDRGVIDATLLAHPAWQADPAAPVSIVIELDGPTTLDLYRATPYWVGEASPLASAARRGIFEVVAARQAPARAFVEAVGATIISTYDTAANGFLALANREQVERLTLTPGVKRVYRAPEHFPLLEDAVPLVGADAAAEQFGFTGKGVTIAIIDTGIDYFHENLGGSGRAKDYQDNDPGTVEARSFPTEKVIGGWDFAGTNYNPGAGRANPVPDADPVDEMGHGSHVAGIAAGMTGNRWVYHGVARDAYLIALKVFGQAGGTNLANDAIEWAIEANMGQRVDGSCRLPSGKCRVDVINLSLGSPWATEVMEAMGVVSRATDAGIVVVASAGNDGNVPYIHGSPSAAPDAIAVANTYASGEKGDVVQVIYDGTTEDLEALEAAETLAKQMAGVGELANVELAWLGRACNSDQPAGDVNEKVALIERGTCPFAEKLKNAEAAGAVGALVHDDGRGLAPWGATPANPVEFPAYMIAQDDGQRLRGLLQSGQTIKVRMSKDLNGTFRRDYLADVISSSSSRGPSRLGEFKPNIAAPGTNIVAPQMGSGNRGVSLSGTSMAGPMVAGAAAVVIDRLRSQGLAPVDAPLNDPGMLAAHDVGALLMNYAGATVWERDNRLPEPVPLVRQGAGRVDVLSAVRGETLLRAGPIAGISFGLQAVGDTYSGEAPVTVRNIGSDEKRYVLSTEMHMANDVDAGVTYFPSPAELTVPAGGTAAVALQVEAVSPAMKPYLAYGGQSAMSDLAGLEDAERDGFLVVTEVDDSGQPVPDGDVARVPIYLLARPASVIRVAPEPLLISPGTGRGAVSVTNEGGGWGRAELFALLGEDGDEGNVGPRLDVDLVGARVGQGPQGERTVDFVVHTDLPRLLPFDSRVWIVVDVNRDGKVDWLVSNVDLGYISTGGRAVNGQQVVYVQGVTADQPIRLANTITLTGYFADTNLNSRTIILPVPAERLGYAAGEPIAFEAAVMHFAFFSEVAGASSNEPRDFVPDNGLTIDGGAVSVGEGRLEFDEAALGYGFDRWSVALDGGQSASLELTRRGDGPADGQRVLASFPIDEPRAGDAKVLAITSGELPTATATRPGPTATPTEGPRPVAAIYLPLIQRRHFAEGR